MNSTPKNYEIERKFLVNKLPDSLSSYPHEIYVQGYLNTSPVIRVRSEGGKCFLTYKGSGFLMREEYNLPIDEASFKHLLAKCDGHIIKKTRYKIPLSDSHSLIAELDIFEEDFEGLIIAEVEFDSLEASESFSAPSWFGREVTSEKKYHNSYLSQHGLKQAP